MLPMLMTRAGSSGVPAASSSGKNARVKKNGAFRLRSTTLSQAAAGNSSIGAPQVAPALLASMFKAGSRWPISPARRRHSASVDRSAGMAMIFPYRVSSRSAAAQASALRELMYTRAPASSSPRAIISPIPRLPPVTTAVFPDRSNKSMISPMQNRRGASGAAGRKAYATIPSHPDKHRQEFVRRLSRRGIERDHGLDAGRPAQDQLGRPLRGMAAGDEVLHCLGPASPEQTQVPQRGCEGIRPGVHRAQQDLVLQHHVPHEAGRVRFDE